MTLRSRLVLYLVVLHAILAALGVLFLWPDHKPWIILLEAVIVLSFLVGLGITRGFGQHLDILSTGAEFIREEDFAHTFSEVDASDVNKLVRLYNDMIRRLREERLRQREQHMFLTRVLEASPTGMVTLDLDGRIDLVNPAARRLLDVEQDASEGVPLASLASPLAQALAALEEESSQVVTLAGRRRVKCTHAHYFEQGFPHSFYLLEELTEELWQSEKHAYETLIRTLSHEVNNTVGATNSILRSVQAYSSQLREADQGDFVRAIGVAVERTDHLNAFMQGFADVIRLPEPSRRPTDLAALLTRLVKTLDHGARERSIELNLELALKRAVVTLDAVQIEQALINVVKNAFEAVDREGRVAITLKRAAGGCDVIVEDSGPGLSEEASENLFIPFFSTKPNGQGIGLTLVHEILTRHGFSASLESPDNQPTRFTIHFPSRG